jgi:hypothetical protein
LDQSPQPQQKKKQSPAVIFHLLMAIPVHSRCDTSVALEIGN